MINLIFITTTFTYFLLENITARNFVCSTYPYFECMVNPLRPYVTHGEHQKQSYLCEKLSNRKPVRRAPERTDIASLMLTLYRRLSLTGTSERILFIWKIWAIASENHLSLDNNWGGRGLNLKMNSSKSIWYVFC